jgi:predicted secreted protein
MLQGIDVLLFDIQDIGARSYTFISTMSYCMQAAKENNIPFVVLDRPNPIGGEIVSGPMMEDRFITFVGVDKLPMSHGMTIGELAKFFNRKIGADLTVVPMQGYTRDMIWQDTGLTWIPTSPMIPDIDAAFGYGATGLGEGTGVGQADTFKWIGGRGINSVQFANLLNAASLPGVTYIPEDRGSSGGARLQITDYRLFDPARSGIYALAIAHSLNHFTVPKSGSTTASIVMFDKIMGTDKIGQWLEQGLSATQIEARYTAALNQFRQERQFYLIYGYLGQAGQIAVVVNNCPIYFDASPLVQNNRVLVPLRAIGQALGASVEWNALTKEIVIAKDGVTTKLVIGRNSAMVNETSRLMDTAPTISQNRTMVPVRFVSEFLGAKVGWDQISQVVSVSIR